MRTHRRDGDVVCLQVRDHGRGINSNFKMGTGLSNTAECLKHLYGSRALRARAGTRPAAGVAAPSQACRTDAAATGAAAARRIRETQPWFHGERRIILKDCTELTCTRRFRAQSSPGLGEG